MTMPRWYVLAGFAILFLALRLPGIALPLHQDEYKWPQIVNPAVVSETEIPHPPLSQFIYQTGGAVVGYDVHLRFVPLAFGLANLFLLWYWMRLRAGERAALWAAALFTFSYFSILASLMVDTDGQILPFFFLLALVGYERVQRSAVGWWGLVGAACLAGFLVKASFVLAIGAIAAEMLWERRALLLTRTVLRYAAAGAGVVGALVLALLAAQLIFPFFDLAGSIHYWEHFASFHHNWFQIGIQAVKAALYLSPLLVLMPLLATRDDFERVRPLVFFTCFGLFFYLILFDFSIGALGRYLQFLIVPLVALAGVVLARTFPAIVRVSPYVLLAGVVAALGIFVVQYEPHAVPALYPKAAWLGRVASFHWAFLYPFSGGSGPLTFYVSFLFLALSWIVSSAVVALAFFKRQWAPALIMLLMPLSLGYNAAFAEEYLLGHINGFAPGLVERAAAFIANDADVQRVVVYNDNGGAEIQATGKYEKRLYTSPDFDWRDKARTINAFNGHYLVTDAPPIDPDGFFAKYFATCIPVYQDTDRYMHATLYDCRKAPPIVL